MTKPKHRLQVEGALRVIERGEAPSEQFKLPRVRVTIELI